MELLGKAKRVRIYVTEDDRAGGRPLHLAIIELLRRENAHGATVFRGVEGFGASGRIRAGFLVDAAPMSPIVVEWIDRPEQVERLAPRIRDLVRSGLVTVEDTDVLVFEPHRVRDLAPSVLVRDVMSRDVVFVAGATPVRDVVELALGKTYRAVPVVEDGRPVGIVTNGDLVRRGGLGVRLDLLEKLDRPEVHDVLDRLAERNRTAADIMTPEPVTVAASASLPEAAELMARRRLKRLPVVDERGALVGVVSRVDLLRTVGAGFGRTDAIPRELGLDGDPPLARVLRREVPTLHPESALPEVFQAVIATRLGRALVVDDERRPVGLVTDAELLERVTPALRPGALRALMQRLPLGQRRDPAAAHTTGRTAADVMSPDLAIVGEDVRLSDAIGTMLRGRHKVLAVTDADGRLAGIVDRADLLHGLLPPRG